MLVAPIRVGVIAAAAFLVISVVALIGRRQWLSEFGPVRASESVSDLDQENQQLRLLLDQAHGTIDNLEAELEVIRQHLASVLEGPDTIESPETEEP